MGILVQNVKTTSQESGSLGAFKVLSKYHVLLILLDSTKLNIVWKKTFFKRRISIIL